MAKFSSRQRLDHKQRQKVLLELCHALVVVKKLDEAAKVLGDLLSDQEIEMIAKRLQIAKFLLQDKKYEEIMEQLKVSATTIARVNLWLQQAGDGFRMVMSRGLAKNSVKIPEWQPPARKSEMARRFPLYYWLQGLLEGGDAQSVEGFW
ncbi:MAG: TrpR like protein, YerC/YecD [Parcubacteria group bacterium GW2011_GWC2_45_7]|nr:MAG: TrpR like protein, YerC/YecD [Parcubacteria group bacterium GW2011_GWC2_45_7]